MTSITTATTSMAQGVPRNTSCNDFAMTVFVGVKCGACLLQALRDGIIADRPTGVAYGQQLPQFANWHRRLTRSFDALA